MLGEITKVVSFKMMDYAPQYSCISGLCLMDFFGGEKYTLKFLICLFFSFLKTTKLPGKLHAGI